MNSVTTASKLPDNIYLNIVVGWLSGQVQLRTLMASSPELQGSCSLSFGPGGTFSCQLQG